MATNLNKADLIDGFFKNMEAILDGKKLTKKAVAEAFDNHITGIVDTVQGGGKVAIYGFGTFSPKVSGERKATNPQDPKGPKIDVPASNSIKFKPVNALKVVVEAPVAAPVKAAGKPAKKGK